MLSGNRIIGHIITSQGGHALTKVLLKFFSNKSNWSLKAGKSISQEMEIEEISKQLSASL